MDEKKSVRKTISHFVATTSSTLFDTFLSDSADQREQLAISETMRQSLAQAAQEKSLVVLQVADPVEKKIVTISGWVAEKGLNEEQVAIRLQADQQTIQMVSLMTIQKLSLLATSGDQASITR